MDTIAEALIVAATTIASALQAVLRSTDRGFVTILATRGCIPYNTPVNWASRRAGSARRRDYVIALDAG